MPKASAQPEYMSGAGPSARPMPCHIGIVSCASTHAKPLWPDFCMEASLTRRIDIWAKRRLRKVLVWSALQRLPKRGSCHVVKCCQNCCWKVANALMGIEQGRGALSGLTGKCTTRPIVMSNGVIGGPWNASEVGTVSVNFIYMQHCWVGRATHVVVVAEFLYTRCVQSYICQFHNRYVVCNSSQLPRGFVKHVPLTELV